MDICEIRETLLFAARDYLDITWEDRAGDEKLVGILMRGMSYLDDIAGCELDYRPEDKPRELLLEYARYVRSGALDEFARNYRHELLHLQVGKEATRYAEQKTADV